MNTPDDKPVLDISQLTPEQRRQIYKEERNIALRSSAKFYGILYLVGCLIIFSGILDTLLNYNETHTLEFSLNTNFFSTLIDAAVRVVMAFIAVWCTGFVLMIPAGIIYVSWQGVAGLVGLLKRIIKKDQN